MTSRKYNYLEVIHAFEVLHSTPHDAYFIGHHFSIFVKYTHHHGFFYKPKRVLKRAPRFHENKVVKKRQEEGDGCQKSPMRRVFHADHIVGRI